MSQNKLTGSIPASVGNLSNLRKLSLFKNHLTGSLPVELSNLTHLALLALDNNSLSGIIPTNIWQCSNLTYLNLGTNNLTGNIPNEIGAAGELRYLLLNDNNLSGTPPQFIGKLQYLKVLDLSNNKFEGTIPTEFCSLRDLEILSLKTNKFNGSIPEKINHLRQLRILDLSQNNLTSLIPRSIGKLEKLISRLNDTFSIDNYAMRSVRVKMVIKGNNVEIVILSSYTSAIDLSCNNFDGSIPEEISLLKGLYNLNLSHNHFSDDIPANLGDMSALESLDLSCNRLSGYIPQSLTSVDSLGFLNLSYNKLRGKIPRSDHFETLSWDGLSLLGNDLLCGFPTDKVCKADNPIFEVEEDDVQEDAQERLLFYGDIALGFGVGFFSLFFVLLLRKEKWWPRYWRIIDTVALQITSCFPKQNGSVRNTITCGNLFFWKYDGKTAYEDIIKATKNFDAKYCIGTGEYGSFYKAELSTGQVVAVKKFHSSDKFFEISDLKSFEIEVHVLTNIRHRNIVSFYGFCSNLDSRTSFLVYEFVERGSLKDVLRSKYQSAQFDWIKRVRFIKGTADALAYLHHGCSPAIIHRGICSDNILLDSEYEARVSDFGTSTIMKPEKQTETFTSNWTVLRTYPELAYPMKANKKYDVYRFGMIIMEVLMGRYPSEVITLLSSDRLPSSSSSSTSSTVGKHTMLKDILDQSIEVPTELMKRQIMYFMKVGFACLHNDPHTRPTMQEVSKDMLPLSTERMPSSEKPFETITLGELLMDSDTVFLPFEPLIIEIYRVSDVEMANMANEWQMDEIDEDSMKESEYEADVERMAAEKLKPAEADVEESESDQVEPVTLELHCIVDQVEMDESDEDSMEESEYEADVEKMAAEKLKLAEADVEVSESEEVEPVRLSVMVVLVWVILLVPRQLATHASSFGSTMYSAWRCIMEERRFAE